MKASILATAACFAGTAIAAPLLEERQISGGEERWSNEDGGNVIVAFGGGRVSFGTIAPKEMVQIIRDECLSIACKPNQDYTKDTIDVVSLTGFEKEMKMVVEGTFAADGQKGDLNQLLSIIDRTLETLHAEGVTIDEEGKYQQGPGGGTCTNPTTCNGEVITVTQWSTTDHLAVQVSNDDGGIVGFINIAWTIDGEKGSGSEICESIAGVSSALAGVIPTIGTAVGAGLTLASTLC